MQQKDYGQASNVLPLLGRVRFAEVDDAPVIMELQTHSMIKNFRLESSKDIVYLIEYCVISISLLDVNDTLIGFMALKDYPPVPSIHPSAWEDFVWRKYKQLDMNPRNSLFVHALIWDGKYGRDVVDRLLKAIFMHDLHLKYIAMMKSVLEYPSLLPGKARAESSFRSVQCSERGVPGHLLPSMCIADRNDVCPRLRVRRAVEEDNDDLLPILERHSKTLRELYGEFYISELIARHPESGRKLLVCEDKEIQQAVGVMCLNTAINFSSLEEAFDLFPFGGLRQIRAKPKTSVVFPVDLKTSEFGTAPPHESSNVELYKRSDRASAQKISWLPDKELSIVTSSHEILSSMPDVDIIRLLHEDSDELEFEIVNIARDMLKVPMLLRYDTSHEHIQESSDIIQEEEESAAKKEEKKASMHRLCKYKQQYEQDKVAVHPKRFDGESNAFLLELFAMHPNYDERHGFDMLEVAFELFPGKDYCVLCLPSNEPPFALLEHFTYVTPLPQKLSYVDESLYVAHVNSVKGKVSLRLAEAYDEKQIALITEQAARQEEYLALYKETLNSSVMNTFVMLSENQPVGVIIVGPLHDSSLVRARFTLRPEPYRAGTDGLILAAVGSPVLEPHYRWLIREVIRLTRYNTIFWLAQIVGKFEMHPLRSLISVCSRMVPIRPKKSLVNISQNKHVEYLMQEVSTPYACWIINRYLASYPKVEVNNNIVVIGASSTGLAFLEHLILGPHATYLSFNNVTLISEFGFPTVADCHPAAKICLPVRGRYTTKYLETIPFHFYIDVVNSVLVKIDRKKKCVYMKGGSVKYYDTLVLACGEQFQHPDYFSKAREVIKEVQKGLPCERVLMDDPDYYPDRVSLTPDLPDNVMIINTLFEANVAIRKVLRLAIDLRNEPNHLCSKNTVIVYGQSIEAYSCITALIQLGVKPHHISFVENFPGDDDQEMRVNCFNDEYVDGRILTNMKRLGVQMFKSSRFNGWRKTGNSVVSTRMLSRLHAFQLPTFALIFYGVKNINLFAFKAVNECGLVYDGGLVIGPSFLTNDPSIYAAGPCTRYSRRLYADKFKHRHCCSEEIGEALAGEFLKTLDPYRVTAPPEPEDVSTNILNRYSSKNHQKLRITEDLRARVERPHTVKTFGFWEPVPKYHHSLRITATLPGPLYYMKIQKPGPEIPFAVQRQLPHRGHHLVTVKNGNFFSIQLDNLHKVEAITCLSKTKFDYDVIEKLYGQHEAFFNKLLLRYNQNLIDDLYKYFTKPWMSAMYQETFTDLMNDIQSQNIGNIYDVAKSDFNFPDQRKESISEEDLLSMPDEMRETATHEFGCFVHIIEDFVAQDNYLDYQDLCGGDIPPECGQTDLVRSEAKAFFDAVHGEKIILKHLTRYLRVNHCTSVHYEIPAAYLDNPYRQSISSTISIEDTKIFVENLESPEKAAGDNVSRLTVDTKTTRLTDITGVTNLGSIKKGAEDNISHTTIDTKITRGSIDTKVTHTSVGDLD